MLIRLLIFWEVERIHILATIRMLVIGSISEACDGDFSRLEAIRKYLLYGGVFLFVLSCKCMQVD